MMTVKILVKEQIRYEILKILSGYCFRERKPRNAEIYILSPWISDVRLELDPEFIYELDWKGFPQEYRIRHINLPYALLLLKLNFGADINIVTRPPKDEVYRKSGRTEGICNLLEFLDEIGCKIFLKPRLHSKLILSNDLAMVGSMNLSKSALDWEFFRQEEIGISIDDLTNLKLLNGYAFELIRSSEPYGYTVRGDQRYRRLPFPIAKITRGWLYQNIVVDYFGPSYNQRHAPFVEFLTSLEDFKSVLNLSSYDVAKMMSSDPESFYRKAVEHSLSSSKASREGVSSFFINSLGYQGKLEIEKVLSFLETKLVREQIPEVRLQIEEYRYEY